MMGGQAYGAPSRLSQWLAAGIPVGSVAGVRIRLHLLLVISLVYYWTGFGALPLPFSWRLGLWAFAVAALFGSVLAHELGHCWGARRVGGQADTVILWPLGGLAVLSGTEKGPKEEIFVTVLGPAVSVALAALFTTAAWAMPESDGGAPLLLMAGAAAQVLAEINWMLALFNMAVPLFPMDCARVVRGLFSFRYNPNRVTYWLTTGGMWLGGAMALAGLTGAGGHFIGPWLGVIGLVGAVASYQERRACQVTDVYLDGPWYWRDAIYRSDTAPPCKPLWVETRDWMRRILTRRSTTPRRRGGPPRVVDASRPGRLRDALKAELDEAVQHEDYNRAAQLRDQIRKMDDLRD